MGLSVERRVLCLLAPPHSVCRVEVEVFDQVIGPFETLIANDNPAPRIDAARPPEQTSKLDGES
jgi:hypothetical protein